MDHPKKKNLLQFDVQPLSYIRAAIKVEVWCLLSILDRIFELFNYQMLDELGKTELILSFGVSLLSKEDSATLIR